MLLYMEKCIHGLSQSCKDFSRYESTATLKRWAENELKMLANQVNQNREADLYEKSELNTKDAELVDKQDDQFTDFKNFVEDVTTKRTVNYEQIEDMVLPYLKTLKTMADEIEPIRFKLADSEDEEDGAP